MIFARMGGGGYAHGPFHRPIQNYLSTKANQGSMDNLLFSLIWNQNIVPWFGPFRLGCNFLPGSVLAWGREQKNHSGLGATMIVAKILYQISTSVLKFCIPYPRTAKLVTPTINGFFWSGSGPQAGSDPGKNIFIQSQMTKPRRMEKDPSRGPDQILS